jgi:hypothetical protein
VRARAGESGRMMRAMGNLYYSRPAMDMGWDHGTTRRREMTAGHARINP